MAYILKIMTSLWDRSTNFDQIWQDAANWHCEPIANVKVLEFWKSKMADGRHLENWKMNKVDGVLSKLTTIHFKLVLYNLDMRRLWPGHALLLYTTI